MKVILIDDIDRVGAKGETVNVKPGFARNYLLPKKKALIATDNNLKFFNDQKNRLQGKEQRRIENAKTIAAKLQTLSLKATLKMGRRVFLGQLPILKSPNCSNRLVMRLISIQFYWTIRFMNRACTIFR